MRLKLLFFVTAIVLSVSACTASSDATVSISEGYITLDAGETYDLDVIVNAAAGTSVQFISKDMNIATVDENGQVTAVGRGETLVTVRAAGATDYVVVRVIGDTVVAYDASDFLAAYDHGDYRIELRDDIVLSEVLEIDRALEIVFNGYTLTADFLVTQSFVGGIALNNERPYEDLVNMTEEDARAFIGTIDMNGFYVNIYGNFINTIDPETFNYIFTNPYEVGDLTYDFYSEYIEIGDAVPVSSIEDLLNIQSESPVVFGKGTPYEKVVLKPYEHEQYVLVNDIKGLTTIAGERIAVVADDGQVFVFNNDLIERSFENRQAGGYRFYYENATFIYDEAGPQTSDFILSDAINAYITDNAITVSEVYTLYEYAFENMEEKNTFLDNITIDGRGFDIEYFELDVNDALFESASGYINIFDVDFRYLVGSADQNEEGLIFEEIDADTVIIQNVDIINNHYVVETSEDDNFGILAGYVTRASVLEMNAMSIEGNSVYSYDSDDLAIVFGQLEESIADISDISLDYNIIFHDDEGEDINDIGIFIGYARDITLNVNDLYSMENLIDTTDGNDMGIFAGTIEDAMLIFNEVDFLQEKMRGEDHMALIVGDLYDSYLSVNSSYISEIDFIGKNTLGFFVGETEYSIVTFNQIDIENSTLVGTYELGGFIGQMNNTSQLNINEFDFEFSSITGSYDLGGLVGDLDDSRLTAFGGYFDSLTLTGTYRVGGMIGDANQGKISIHNAVVGYIDITAINQTGAVIGEAFESVVDITETSVDYISFAQNEINFEEEQFYSIGGIIGYVYDSHVVVFDTNIEFTNPIVATFDVGGVVGFLEFGSLVVNRSNISIDVEADTSVGGVVGSIYEATLEVVSSNVILDVNDQNEVINLRAVGGLVGKAYGSRIVLFGGSIETNASEIVDDFGGLVGDIRATNLEALNTYVEITLNLDSRLENFDASTFGIFIGEADGGKIEIYYQSTVVDVIDSALVITDINSGTYFGIGSYSINEVEPVVLRS